mmetsp:Transcript_3372/g.3258  ORF Transcript_3372/g.3258 Transcript_3372/m.3258 type:complete len:120 (-) Transcript_3372:61-420(-)
MRLASHRLHSFLHGHSRSSRCVTALRSHEVNESRLSQMATVPIVVLGNKIDVRNAASEEEFRQALGLHSHTTFGREIKSTAAAHAAQESGIRPVEVFMCSVIKRMGYAEGFKWLAQFLE